VAAILSVVESFRGLGAPVKDYFAAVLPRLNRGMPSAVANLTPVCRAVAAILPKDVQD